MEKTRPIFEELEDIDFLPYKLSFQLKGLGYNEKSIKIHIYDKEDVPPGMKGEDNGVKLSKDFCHGIRNKNLIMDISCTAILWQQAAGWFRTEHNMLGTVYSNASGYLWEWHDDKGGTQREWSEYSGDCEHSGTFTTYERAEQAMIERFIEIISEKKSVKK